MSKMSDHYPVGMSKCDSFGLGGQCGEDCPLLASEEYVRFEEECYPYREYMVVKNKHSMSAVKHLVVDEE
jgi:hypothetical protein